MKKSTMLGLALSLVATSAMASNTGFKLNYPLVFAGTNNNWLSLPYFYFPNGNVGQTGQNSLDICADLNGAPNNNSKVTQVIKWNTASDTPTTTSCIGKTSFPFVTGEGYSVKPFSAGIVIDIVGSHDDEYAFNKGGTKVYPLIFLGTNNNWFSMPYHSKANNSLDACTSLNGAPNNNSKVTQVIKWNTTTDTPTTTSCIGKTQFPLVPGEGYSIKPALPGIGASIDVY